MGCAHRAQHIRRRMGPGRNALLPITAPRGAGLPGIPRCGGCALRHMDYAEELSLKLQRVNDALHRIGKLDFSVSGILPAPEDARQRRKVIFNVAKQNGRPSPGFTARARTRSSPCRTAPPYRRKRLRVRRQCLTGWSGEHIPVYDEAAKRDGVRHIFYRSSHLTEKAVLTLTASRSPGEKALGILTDMLRERCPDVTGLVLNRNTARSNTVLPESLIPFGAARCSPRGCAASRSRSPARFSGEPAAGRGGCMKPRSALPVSRRA